MSAWFLDSELSTCSTSVSTDGNSKHLSMPSQIVNEALIDWKICMLVKIR